SRVRIDAQNIHDWNSFHDEFSRIFGFPTFYGRNMDAWVDCLTSIDCEEHGMSSIHVRPGVILTLEIIDAAYLKKHCREQYDAIVECSAFANWRESRGARIQFWLFPSTCSPGTDGGGSQTYRSRMPHASFVPMQRFDRGSVYTMTLKENKDD